MTLGFNPDQLLRFESRVNQLTHQARIQKAASAGHLEVRPLAVVAAQAQEAVGGKAVIASFRTDNGQVYPFGLQSDEARNLQKQLVEAIAKAEKQARQTRQ